MPIIPKPKKRSAVLRERRKAHNAETAEIRDAVMTRARSGGGFRCESCTHRTPAARLVMDHWLSGNGRRRQLQAVANCWALCVPCHQDRTDNTPSASFWNTVFAKHCHSYGYPLLEHIVHQRLGATRRTE